ncbi:14067_t:CDS:2, partial [Racocetra fulgida]
SNIENNSIEIIPIQEVSHSNIENNSIEIIPIQEVSSSNIENNFIEIIPIQEVSQYIINTIDDLEDYAELSLVLRIQLDESMISDTDINVKTIAKLIIDEIEDGDATTAPNLSARHHNIGNAYFACSQSSELERELKDSNRKRTIRYNCGGKVSIKIDIPAAEAKITLKHKILHNKPIEVETPSEVKQEINKHLHLNPVELRQHLRKKFNISNVTSKQIHYCQDGLRTEALTGFFLTLRNKGLNPTFFYSDKDFAEITAAKNVWPLIDIQLCLWHLEKAIKNKLKSRKKIERINYNYEEVIKEFTFVDSSFIPDLQHTDY